MNHILFRRKSVKIFNNIILQSSKAVTSLQPHTQVIHVSKRDFSSSKLPKNEGIVEKYFGKESCIASPDFTNRWSMAIPAFITQMSIGSPWAWSLVVCDFIGVHFPIMGHYLCNYKMQFSPLG